MGIQDMYDRLTEEQKAAFKDCKNQDDFLRKVQEEGIELTDEQLEAISGGECDWFGIGPEPPYENT